MQSNLQMTKIEMSECSIVEHSALRWQMMLVFDVRAALECSTWNIGAEMLTGLPCRHVRI